MASKKEYIERNERWLEETSKQPDVLPLAKGVCYRVIEEGDPASTTPDMNSVVTVRYIGRTVDGRQFDASGPLPVPFRLRELIPGWCIALQKMHIGDCWEIYVPAEQGYGRRAQPDIPGGSTLIFDITLTGIA